MTLDTRITADCGVCDVPILLNCEEYDVIDGVEIHPACALAEDLPSEHAVDCPDCKGQGYDLASYRRAKHPDQIDNCGTCNGRGRVLPNPLALEIPQ